MNVLPKDNNLYVLLSFAASRSVGKKRVLTGFHFIPNLLSSDFIRISHRCQKERFPLLFEDVADRIGIKRKQDYGSRMKKE